MKKIRIYLRSGGLHEVINYAIIKLKKIFYYKSETIFLYKEKVNLYEEIRNYNKSFQFTEISTIDNLEKLKFERINVLNYNSWVKKGSRVIVGSINHTPISFAWLHFNSYSVNNQMTIDLSNDKCWIGPTFVDKLHRGNGLNKAQINYHLYHTSNPIKYFLTSANSKNIASIKSFEKLGFQTGVKHVKLWGLFAPNIDNFFYDNAGKDIFKIS